MDYHFISPHTRRHLVHRFRATGPDRYSKTQHGCVMIKCSFTRDGGFCRRVLLTLQDRFWGSLSFTRRLYKPSLKKRSRPIPEVQDLFLLDRTILYAVIL